MPSPPRVLLVEDNRAAVTILRVMLGGADGEHPFAVTHASSLHDACTALKTDGPFDAVVLDLGLPDSDGLDTYLMVRQAAPDAAVVVLSDAHDAEAADRAVDLGALGHLRKQALDRDDLVRTVDLGMARQEARSAVARALRTADEANARLQDLVQRAQRELLSPVATVHALTQALVDDWDRLDPEARHDRARRVERAAARMSRTGTHVLHNAAAEAGAVARHRDVLAPASLVDELVADLDLEDVHNDLSPQLRCAADVLDLDTILCTLLRNASRHQARVVVDGRPEDGAVTLGVADHGPAVPTAEARDLFRRTPRRGQDAGGLVRRDLFVARRMARANGGDLRHDPAWASGARFVLTLPAAEPAIRDRPLPHARAA